MNENFEFKKEIVEELTEIKGNTKQIKEEVTKLNKQINGNGELKKGIEFRVIAVEGVLEGLTKEKETGWQKLTLKGKVTLVILVLTFLVSYGVVMGERLIKMFEAGMGM
ncbi:MAG: hypothetical protein K8R79_02010 [Calditrichales bacterium]|nr:hypothetical protein [Calditrichales bacterium]